MMVSIVVGSGTSTVLDGVRVVVELQLHVCGVGGGFIGDVGEDVLEVEFVAWLFVVFGVVVGVEGVVVVVVVGGRVALCGAGAAFATFSFSGFAGSGLG